MVPKKGVGPRRILCLHRTDSDSDFRFALVAPRFRFHIAVGMPKKKIPFAIHFIQIFVPGRAPRPKLDGIVRKANTPVQKEKSRFSHSGKAVGMAHHQRRRLRTHLLKKDSQKAKPDAEPRHREFLVGGLCGVTDSTCSAFCFSSSSFRRFAAS